ncbi:MAG TPA: DnaJ C-terminal domain-containing protein [Methylophilaceae bacterium]|nr:DnaJ C-terminal domain-containing protein [Methylophilaceae bacterium]
MEYKDYYRILGVDKNASQDEIKKAYKKLAHKHHPDVAKHTSDEEKFKEIAEAYATLKDPEKRAAYDALGSQQAGREFQPPPGWETSFGGQEFSYEDLDLSDLFAHFGGGRRGTRQQRGGFQMPGQDYEVTAEISLEDAYKGATLDLNLSLPEYDQNGRLQHVPNTFKVRIPKGVADNQRLRLRGKGGKGFHGGPDGDLWLNIKFRPHPLFRADGHDLYLDLPLAPWEAALGATVEVPTLDGSVNLKIPAGTNTGQKLRLARKGLPKQKEETGNLFAIAQIVVPPKPSERERKLLKELADSSNFNPRSHFR